jgi:pimeloyl-ACP methyl ester carboxylesterase
MMRDVLRAGCGSKSYRWSIDYLSRTAAARRAFVLALLVALAPNTTRAQLDRDQRKCLEALNRDAAKLAAAQGKVNTACLKNAGKGKLPVGQSADQCLFADAKGKVMKAKGKLSTDVAGKCAVLPPFGVPGGTVAGVISGVAVDQSLNLLADILGGSLTTAAIDCAADKNGCKCQQGVGKAYEKLAAKKLKEFVKCKKVALAAGAGSAAALEDCVDAGGTPGSIAADTKGKIAKARQKVDDAISRKCAGVSTARAFPGLCAGLSGTALGDCIDQRVECRVCLTIDGVDDLAVDCDTFDDGALNLSCPYETFNLRSLAAPAESPGSAGVTVTNPKLLTQFGSTDVSVNNARFTRFRLNPFTPQPDAILILVPGFEGGANDFKVLAENLIPRVFTETGLALELWAYDRRSNQLEDLVGLEIAEAQNDALIALDWLYGGELMLTLHPSLVAGPNRRAVFYDTQADVPFLANWTPLVFARDIDAIVEKARTVAKNQNVFLGGHSMGTTFTARFAATDFDLTGGGPAEPGYAKLRGLVLLEGGGGSTAGTPLTADTLDRIEAKFDGGLFGAVRDNAGRCVDGTTPCTIGNEATTCAGQMPAKCTLPVTAYSTGLLNPRLLAAAQPTAIQAVTDPDTGQNILAVDQGSPGNTAIAKVPDLASLTVTSIFPPATAQGGLGLFVDDDGIVAAAAPFVAVSVGTAGAVVGGLLTWHDITEGPMPPGAVPDNGPPPTTLPSGVWGQEKEVTRMDRMVTNFFAGHTDFTDWYFPSSGLGVTSVTGVCTSGTCAVGNVGASCSTAAACSQAISLDSSPLSIGRGRRDIENLTQAASINIPVIGFGGTNGLARVPGSYTAFGQSIGVCTAPSCDGTARVVDASTPNPAFPTFGGVAGGFEVHMSEGFAHLDVVTAEDNADNNVLEPLTQFLARNVQ